MDTQKIKEDLSISYMSIVSAVAGIGFEIIRHDEDSIDSIIKKVLELVGGNKFNSQISVQLKTTSSKSQYTDNSEYITYKLKVKNFNDLCMAATMPSILALLILPEDENEWVNWSPEEIILNGCMYWVNLQSCDNSENAGKVSVKIPKTKRINSDNLLILLEKAAKEGAI